ncbi:putative ATP-dependent RNA helicase DDX60 [Oculina patagonica]
MAEGGEDYYSSSDEDDADALPFDSDTDDLCDEDDDLDEDVVQLEDDEDGNGGKDAIAFLKELDSDNQTENGGQSSGKPRLNISKCMSYVSEKFYRQKVTPLHINILTDFVDAEIFMIDGDSLLLELLGEESLDWRHGGQFLYLTYLLERFLQYFTDKGGVFHIVFFKEMEIIWKTQPSMLLARQAIILHLQYNTRFTVVTSIGNFWEEQWHDYVDDKIPAFLLLTDAENIPWKTSRAKKAELEFFFRSFLLNCLGHGLNCVFISGIEMTATKVMGFYVESSSYHKFLFMGLENPVWETWHSLMSSYRKDAPVNDLRCQGTYSRSEIDFKGEIQAALQSPPQGGCRELATVLACAQFLCKALDDPATSKETMKTEEDRIKLFLLHIVLLNKLPLKYRAQAINSTLLKEFYKAKGGTDYPFHEIHLSLWKILRLIHDVYSSMASEVHALDMSSVADLMDGRLIHALFFLALEETSTGLEGLSLPEDVINEAEAVWTRVVAVVNSSHSDSLERQFLPLFAGNVTGFYRFKDSSKSDSWVKLRRLLDVENVLVDEYAGDIRSKINTIATDDSQDEVFNIGREFDERYHWHSLRPLTDKYERTKETFTEKPPDDPKKKFWYNKNKQTFARFLRFYGNSIEGGIDRAKTITVTETDNKKKKGKDKAGKLSKKKAQIIEDNEQRRKDKDMKREEDKWNHALNCIESRVNKRNYITALESVEEFLSHTKFPQQRLPALMKKAMCCFGAWQDERYGDLTSSDMKYAVLLMETTQEIAQKLQSFLTAKDKKTLAGYMQKLGFQDIAAVFSDSHSESKERDGKLSVHQTSARFQLEHMGHLLKREEPSDRDPRVEHFNPDMWQRELLDAVDKNESAVIVAPTSSGKTYASYYCMEKVLRQSNDGVVVYVSPTKALVNQVVATVYARFHRKQLPEGRAVYGVFTRDYRYNTLNSQILITVPQCLEILFLSPHRQNWTKNVKYVIFDEVHCLGQEEGAEVWEHLLLLIRCPFLALSATIGNPHHLMEWLQAAQDFREKQDKQDNGELRNSYKISLVICDERYSDLEKSIYLPSPSIGGFSEETGKYENIHGVKNTDEFVRLHPCAQLGIKQLRENGFPGDMALTPKETLQLYDVMVQHWPDKESLKDLVPEQYFTQNAFIHKSHVRQYEMKLKQELKSWVDDKHLEKVEAVIQTLNSVCVDKRTSTEEEWGKLGMSSTDKIFIRMNFPKLVEQLKAQDKLPALVFSFDRVQCEILAEGITRELVEREKVLKGDKSNLKLEKDKEKKQRQSQKQMKKKRDLTEKEKARRASSQRGNIEDQDEKKELPVSDEPLPECTLAFTHGIGKEDLKKIIDRIRQAPGRKTRKHTIAFKLALKRGISYHHAGLDNKRRSAVEMLFRRRYLQVVTATSTLALGIHMPCKTVVFAGDSTYLNSLQYRQMSGRAGRRGFDPVGNVVFFGVPYRKVQRLITANIPKLVGNFPINVTLVLRLLLMTSKGDDNKDALTKALTLLSHPFICRKQPEMDGQIKKHFLFSVELLARLGLINKTGAPQEMAGLVTHLHYHEPSNFVLVSFLQRGLFHKICKGQRRRPFSEHVMRKMVLVLSHLFGRRFLHANFKRVVRLCPTSKVILEDLPYEFAEALQDYNRQVTDVFSQYLTTVAAEIEKDRGEENKLPLSGIEFPNEANLVIEDNGEHDTLKKLARNSVPYSACSSFAALSGNSDLEHASRRVAAYQDVEEDSDDDEDTFEEEDDDGSSDNGEARYSSENDEESGADSETESEEDDVTEHREPIDHLLKILRQDVYTDMNVVPILPLKKLDAFGRVRRLNSYALDFFKHGQSEAIIKENKIKAGDVFVVLKDFCLTVKSISCSLEELGPQNDNVVVAFKQLAEEFGRKFKKQFGAEI